MINTSSITVIRHHHNTTELTDNDVTHLTRRGFNIETRSPFDGDKLDPAIAGVTPTIVLGGAQNVTDRAQYNYLADELRWIEACIASNTPVLGICLGAQLIAHALGAKVSMRQPTECEYGFYQVSPTEAASNWLSKPTLFMQAHFQEFSLPDGADRLAYSERFPQQAFRYGQSTYALQFHPEVNTEIFNNWLADTWSDEMVAATGAQSKSEQAKIAAQCLPEQAAWFEQMLDGLFTGPDLHR